MKTMNINDNLKLKCHDDTEDYRVTIDNLTKRVIDHSSEFTPISSTEIQKIVDKLIKLEMITIIGEIDDVTEVSIPIWTIDETDDLYIETYHDGDYDDVSDYDRIMLYSDFLNH